MAQPFRIINATIGYVFHGDDGGNGPATGDLHMSGDSYDPQSEDFYLYEVPSGGYRIIANSSGYYVHGDGDGTGGVHLVQEAYDRCQIYELEPNGDGKFRLRNTYSNYYVHADDDGTGELRMYPEKNDVCQLVTFYELNTNPQH